MSFSDWWWSDREDMKYWPPYARLIWQQLNEIHAMLRRGGGGGGGDIARIEQKLDMVINEVRAFRRDEQRSDVEMADVVDDILAKLEAANTRQDEFLVILNALKANQNNPEKLQQIARSVTEQQDDWEAAFAAGLPPDPEPTPGPGASTF